MKQQLRGLLGNMHSVTPLSTLVGLTQKRILLPFYHTVSDRQLPHIRHLYQLRNTDLFIKDLEFYLKHYRPVSLCELQQLINSQTKLSKPVFHLTLDDGLAEIYSTVAPILEQKGVPATVFVNSGFIDNAALFYRYKVSLLIETLSKIQAESIFKALAEALNIPSGSKEVIKRQLLASTYHDLEMINKIAEILQVDFAAYLQKEKPYLTTSEISSLLKRGFTIGSHSIDHPHFNSISVHEQKRQIEQSFNFLQQHFGITEKHFSFPFSDDGVSLKFLRWLHEEAGCQLSFGISGLKEDFSGRHLHRIAIEGTHKSVEQIIKSEYLYYLLKAPLFKNTISRK